MPKGREPLGKRLLFALMVPWVILMGATPPSPGSRIPIGHPLAQARASYIPPASEKDPVLSSRLASLGQVDQVLREGELGLAALGEWPAQREVTSALQGGALRIDDGGKIQVWIYTPNPEGTAERVQSLGGRVERISTERGIVQAWVPVAWLREVRRWPEVKYVEEPPYPHVQQGTIISEGDFVIRARDLRRIVGLAGRGVRVGVISDGVRGLALSQSRGELPSVNYLDCNVVPGTDPTRTGAEGTAMLEIIHDLAPEAELWFGHFAMGTPLDFNAAVNCLAERVDIIVDDISWINVGPYDGTSLVSVNTALALNSSGNPLRAYMTAVGNLARSHYQEKFSSCGSEGVHQFTATARTVDRDGIGPSCSNPILVAPRTTLKVFVQWNEPFGGACDDYDAYLFPHGSLEILAYSENPQTCTQNPTEQLIWHNGSEAPAVVDLLILSRGANVREFDIFFIGGSPNFYTPPSSVPNQADARGGVLAVGAINVFDPTNRELSPESGRGPTNDGRLKPDITATDGVRVSGSGGFYPRFFGTSAAAPHVAGVAALLLECRADLLRQGGPDEDSAVEREALREALLLTAQDLGPPGQDNGYGHGLLDAVMAASYLCRDVSQVMWGDLDCTRSVDAVDALTALRYVVGLPVSQQQPCPVVGGAIDEVVPWGDVDCDARVSAVDALKILRYTVGLPVSAPEQCPALGSLVTLLPPFIPP